jgi:hypothetical protein
MISSQKKEESLLVRYLIVGSRRLSNYWWSTVIFLGGCGFLFTGFSSFFNRNLLLIPYLTPYFQGVKGYVDNYRVENREVSLFNQVPILPFFPQGLVLSFYGFLGVAFSFHLFFALFWEIGGGFNEINKKEKSVRIFRWGRPGKNRRIDIKYSNELMNAIKIELSPKPALFLCLKGDKKIPLTRIGELPPLEDLETQAAELTSLLQVPLEIADS